jgi:hypothetical protein
MRKYLDGQWTYQGWCDWVCGMFMEKGSIRDDDLSLILERVLVL